MSTKIPTGKYIFNQWVRSLAYLTDSYKCEHVFTVDKCAHALETFFLRTPLTPLCVHIHKILSGLRKNRYSKSRQDDKKKT